MTAILKDQPTKLGLKQFFPIHIEPIELKTLDNLKDHVQKTDAEDQSEKQK
jgi:hypothetical protein